MQPGLPIIGFEQPVNGSELAARMEKHAKSLAEVRSEEVIELSLDSRVKGLNQENIYEAGQ